MAENAIIKNNKVTHQAEFQIKGLMMFVLACPQGEDTFKVEKKIYDISEYSDHSDLEYIRDMLNKAGYVSTADDLDRLIRDEFKIEVHHMMDGPEFAEEVSEGGLESGQGYVKEVIVDGYITNLEYSDSALTPRGQFMMTEEAWSALCYNHNVLVNWVNY